MATAQKDHSHHEDVDGVFWSYRFFVAVQTTQGGGNFKYYICTRDKCAYNAVAELQRSMRGFTRLGRANK